ncbi:unnamed protein product [Vitrella brassicaformis CCMP3155]|uniref:Uncharacterized protein n=1 Tax=Vitrella brassicaformis (strain CCMP3155) TaxID=1169540 RepID=A0A0G4FVR6_VITBC|nr:unnamed protein product [Vitrella brassicaformis CCMP3155]|eukprot:CEM18677.1 unnamed protein product [Vitrella brassicaformis CCMP3155]
MWVPSEDEVQAVASALVNHTRQHWNSRSLFNIDKKAIRADPDAPLLAARPRGSVRAPKPVPAALDVPLNPLAELFGLECAAIFEYAGFSKLQKEDGGRGRAAQMEIGREGYVIYHAAPPADASQPATTQHEQPPATAAKKTGRALNDLSCAAHVVRRGGVRLPLPYEYTPGSGSLMRLEMCLHCDTYYWSDDRKRHPCRKAEEESREAPVAQAAASAAAAASLPQPCRKRFKANAPLAQQHGPVSVCGEPWRRLLQSFPIRRRPPYELSHLEVMVLEESEIETIQLVSRPADPPCNPCASGESCEHYGVIVTLVDRGIKIRYGNEGWLIHKGKGYGYMKGDTIVTSKVGLAQERWNFSPQKHQAIRGVTVGDLKKVGGLVYDFDTDNCRHAGKRMIAKAIRSCDAAMNESG